MFEVVEVGFSGGGEGVLVGAAGVADDDEPAGFDEAAEGGGVGAAAAGEGAAGEHAGQQLPGGLSGGAGGAQEQVRQLAGEEGGLGLASTIRAQQGVGHQIPVRRRMSRGSGRGQPRW